MNMIRTSIRLLLALMLTVFGASKFIDFMPAPNPPEEGGAFLGALNNAGYIFPTLGAVFLVCAACLVFNRVVLALLLLTPITVNILFYHGRFDIPGIGGGAMIAILQVAVAWMYRRDLKVLLAPSQGRTIG